MSAVALSEDVKGNIDINELAETDKARLIAKACRERDVDTLVQLVDSRGGLLTDTLRQDACTSLRRDKRILLIRVSGPILLGCYTDDTKVDAQSWRQLPRHRDEDQVQLDVNRSFIYYPNGRLALYTIVCAVVSDFVSS